MEKKIIMNFEVVANENWRPPEGQIPKISPQNRMSVFLDLCKLFCRQKLSARLSWSHNGVNIGTTLLYVVIFTVIGAAGLSHFLKLVSSTRSLVCVCVCAISFLLGFSTQCSGVLHFSHSTTAHCAFSMISGGRLVEKAKPAPPPPPINHIR
jgi:hypothetical protein